MNELKVFNFENSEVRTRIINNEPWFCLKDVCEILEIKNPTDVSKRLFKEELTRLNLGGRSGNTNFVNESGLYNVIFRSDKSQAIGFRRWVTSEVLPTIRKHGAYMTPDKIEEALLNPDTIIKLATDLKNERLEKEEAQNKLKQQEPQVVFARTVEVSQNSVAVKVLSTILKQNDINVGQNRMFQWLRDNKYLSSRQGKSWNMPTQKSMDLGLFELKANTYFHNNGTPETNYTPLVTGKGQVYFVNKFLEKLQEA